jgi:predicted small metal-binding protein
MYIEERLADLWRSRQCLCLTIFYEKGGKLMAKILECAKVDPASGCQHVIRGETEEEVLRKAAEHAKEHGIREVTPELMERVKTYIRDT